MCVGTLPNLLCSGETMAQDPTELGVAQMSVDPEEHTRQDLPGAAAPPATDDSDLSSGHVRSALIAMGQSASSFTSTMKSKSYVFKLGIETVQRLVSPAAAFAESKVLAASHAPPRMLTRPQWNSYGEPILQQLDDTLDATITTIRSATERQERVRCCSGFAHVSHSEGFRSGWRPRPRPRRSSATII